MGWFQRNYYGRSLYDPASVKLREYMTRGERRWLISARRGTMRVDLCGGPRYLLPLAKALVAQMNGLADIELFIKRGGLDVFAIVEAVRKVG